MTEGINSNTMETILSKILKKPHKHETMMLEDWEQNCRRVSHGGSCTGHSQSQFHAAQRCENLEAHCVNQGTAGKFLSFQQGK